MGMLGNAKRRQAGEKMQGQGSPLCVHAVGLFVRPSSGSDGAFLWECAEKARIRAVLSSSSLSSSRLTQFDAAVANCNRESYVKSDGQCLVYRASVADPHQQLKSTV